MACGIRPNRPVAAAPNPILDGAEALNDTSELRVVKCLAEAQAQHAVLINRLPELLPDEYLVLDQAAPVADTAANFEAVLDGADVLGPSAVGKRERDATAAKL